MLNSGRVKTKDIPGAQKSAGEIFLARAFFDFNLVFLQNFVDLLRKH
jgi:hypothetical protein